MSETACPHYTSHITGTTGICRGCGATVVNPTDATAKVTGLVAASGAPVKISEAAAPFATISRPERTRNR